MSSVEETPVPEPRIAEVDGGLADGELVDGVMS
jgi:hypothetical protein